MGHETRGIIQEEKSSDIAILSKQKGSVKESVSDEERLRRRRAAVTAAEQRLATQSMQKEE